jgi:F like protein
MELTRSRGTDAVAMVSNIDIRLDLSNADVGRFLRNYDFAWARRQLIFDVEALRAIFLRAETEGWSLVRLGTEIEAAGQLDGELADLLARTETIRAANFGAIASYSAAGVERIVWLADSDACQYCRKLNRKAIPIGKPFLEPGSFQARKNGRPLLIREAVLAPPLHWGCRCAVRAGID